MNMFHQAPAVAFTNEIILMLNLICYNFSMFVIFEWNILSLNSYNFPFNLAFYKTFTRQYCRVSLAWCWKTKWTILSDTNKSFKRVPLQHSVRHKTVVNLPKWTILKRKLCDIFAVTLRAYSAFAQMHSWTNIRAYVRTQKTTSNLN